MSFVLETMVNSVLFHTFWTQLHEENIQNLKIITAT